MWPWASISTHLILRVLSSETESMPCVLHRIGRAFQEVSCVNRFRQGLVPAHVFAAVVSVAVIAVIVTSWQ